jgi:2-methylcitrate dehydratase PrpD
MDYTRKLAEFCAGVSFQSLPDEVVRKAKLCVLDYVANVYGSLELDAVQRIISYFKGQPMGDGVSVLGCGFKAPIRDAVFINGTTAEAIEAQDGVRFGGNHPVSAVIPTALAVAENLGLGGREVIEAVVAGYDAADRPAAAMHPFHTLSGFLPTGTCGAFGAAAAAARLMELGADGMLNALGNAGYLLPLSMAEDLMGGYTVKIVQGGQAAAAGLVAAGLAGAGITGHPQVLEGSELGGGFTQITVRAPAEPVFDRITDGLGEHYTIMDVYFKPFTACRHTHGAAQATLELVEENGIDASDVESVNVRTYAIGAVAVGKGVSPGDSFVAAQFSVPYVVAACLTDGELGPAQLTERRMADSGLLELAGRVTVEQDDELNGMYPDKTASRVEIKMRDGRSFSRQVDTPKGDPRDPMEEDDVADKVRRFAGAGRRPDVERVIELALDLGNVKSISGLTESI